MWWCCTDQLNLPQRSSRERRDEVSDDPTVPRVVSHPPDVPVFAGLAEWLLWLDNPSPECTNSGEQSTVRADSGAACRPGWGRRESAYLGRPALCRRAVRTSPGGAPDASGWAAGRTAAAGVAEETRPGLSPWDPE